MGLPVSPCLSYFFVLKTEASASLSWEVTDLGSPVTHLCAHPSKGEQIADKGERFQFSGVVRATSNYSCCNKFHFKSLLIHRSLPLTFMKSGLFTGRIHLFAYFSWCLFFTIHPVLVLNKQRTIVLQISQGDWRTRGADDL